MADRSGGVVTNCIRARQVRPLSPNPRSGRVENIPSLLGLSNSAALFSFLRPEIVEIR